MQSLRNVKPFVNNCSNGLDVSFAFDKQQSKDSASAEGLYWKNLYRLRFPERGLRHCYSKLGSVDLLSWDTYETSPTATPIT